MRPRRPGRARRSWILPRVLVVLASVLAPVSRRASGGVLAWLWFVPWQARSRSGVPVSSGHRRATITVADTHVVVTELGDGATVLLVHGWSDRGTALESLAGPLVDAGYRVVTVDLPAHGDSPGTRTDVFEAARVIAALVDRYAARHVVAHSFGALATSLAIKDGARIDRVVLLAPAVRLDRVLASFTGMYPVARRAVPALAASLERRFGASVWDEVAADQAAVAFATPALIVHDRDDRRVDVADARALAQAWPGARLVETTGLGHRRLLRDPDVAARVVEFIGVTTGRDAPAA